jgi:hypothetical protein
LIRSRKQLAQQHYEQVRVTVQAMLLRGIDPVGITVSTVSKEAGVSVATIYRREELFALVQHVNPQVQRRVSEQVYQGSLRQLQEELERAKAEVVASQNEAQLAKLGARRPQQEVIQLKKTLVALQRQVVCLEALLARCTCGMQSNPPD